MQEVDINTLVNKIDHLNKNIPNNIIIVGVIKVLRIEYKYDKLDLSKVECDELYYKYQKGKSIKNHILPNSLKELICWDNQLTSLPDLPHSLKLLNCYNNKLTSLPDLPNSLKQLNCSYNQLTLLPDLPNSLKELFCYNNRLTFLPDIPNSLIDLNCYNNQLTLLIGGSKVSTKLSMIRYFLDKADNILIGGGMAFTFLKAKSNSSTSTGFKR